MPNFENRNIHEKFDDNVNIALGQYVYILYDTIEGKKVPFYVGKGGGREGQGNQRVLAHFDEAKKQSNKSKASSKIKKIHDIWQKNDVGWAIVRSGIGSEEEAYRFESTVINMLEHLGYELTNEQHGADKNSSGKIMEPDDVYAHLAPTFGEGELPKEYLDRPIFLFNVANEAASNGENYEEATREAWMMGKRFRDYVKDSDPNKRPIAIGLKDRVSRAVFRVDSLGLKGKKWRMNSDPLSKTDLDNAFRHQNYNKIISKCQGYWGYGNWVAFQIDGGTREIRIIRGKLS